MIALPFPPPPSAVVQSLARLQNPPHDDRGQAAPRPAAVDQERPWEPASCNAELGAEIWSWCRDVVAWINHEYVWRPADMIPACWLQHAHIARELPVLAIQRWKAENARVPDLVDKWNEFAFPGFWGRMMDRLGDGTCRNGKHQDWPAESRYTAVLNANPPQL